MKIGLITTTINIPTVLALYRKLGPDVRFFVAIDEKTPEEAGNYLAYDLPNTQISYLKHEWKCSPLIGYNTDSRRNIALLEAVKWGAEIIVSIDDDMIPISPDFFQRIEDTLTLPFSGLQLGAPGYWFDAGGFTLPPARQRGLPLGRATVTKFGAAHGVQVGAMQGIILGVPDTDALNADANRITVAGANDVLREGFVVDPKACSVFNSQFTAFRRELAPCFAQFYKWQGRNTDIFASLVMRRVMREKNLYCYFGPPTGFHARTARDPLKDLKAEMFGLEHVQQLAGVLENMERFAVDKPIVRQIHEKLATLDWWPKQNAEAAIAFCDDIEGVL